MGKLNLHIANANKKFTEDEQRMARDAVTAAELFINSHFDFDYDVDLIITAPSFFWAQALKMVLVVEHTILSSSS